jgi:hypothetical protein
MLLRLSYLFLLIALALGAFLYVYFNRQNDPTPMFVGASRCSSCHSPEHIGSQFRLWQTGPHSKAYMVLQTDSVKTYLASQNISVDSCMSCHTTLGRPALNRAETALNSEGVGCERCHGPGSEYSYYNVMTDQTAFVSRGGVVGTLNDCGQCHAKDLANTPGHCPFQTRDFDADSAWIQVRHPIPPKPVEPDTVQQLRES